MRAATNRIRKQLRALPDSEKLVLVDAILSELDKPDPAVDRLWAREAERRWKDYKSGKVKAVPASQVLGRFGPR